MNLSNYEKKIETRVRKFENQYYLLGNKKSYQLNYTGAVVLKYIGTEIELETLAKKISAYYKEDNINQIEEDIVTFLDFLLSENLIVSRD